MRNEKAVWRAEYEKIGTLRWAADSLTTPTNALIIFGDTDAPPRHPIRISLPVFAVTL